MTITQPEDRIDLVVDRGIRVEQSAEPAPDQSPEAAPGRPQFTITDAAAACAVSRKTITRKLADLAEHGAAKDADGVWRIPVEALLAVGLHPGRSVAEQGRPNVGAQPAPQPPGPGSVGSAVTDREMVTVPRDRWDDLRIRLARAEAEASERALALADARLALRALTAAPQPALEARGSQGESLSAPSAPGTLGPRSDGSVGPPVAGIAGIAGATVPTAPAAPTAVGVASTASGSGATSPLVATGGLPPSDDPAALVASARIAAAQRGGYVPPAGATVRKRRWWQSK